MADRWTSLPVVCKGGLVLNSDTITQGTTLPGSAIVLQNFEPALEGGYKRILGHSKWDSTVVPGDALAPVLGVAVGLGGVFACRYLTGTTDNSIYFSAGSGWTKVNTDHRAGTVNKMRGITSYITTPAMIFVDGVNYAAKWDGTTWTVINGTGAPLGAKFLEVFGNKLVLAGYGTSQEISISEPDSDTLFDGASGAASIPVNDKINAIKTFRGDLYIYCENSIKKLTGSTSTDYAIVNITDSIGCISADSVQELGGDIIFLSPDGFRSTAATSRIGDVELGLVSRAIQPLVRTELAGVLPEYKYSSLVIRSKSQYRSFFNDAGNESGQIGFLGKLTERVDPLGELQYDWATMMGVKPYCADSQYTNDQEIAVFGHPTDGYVRRFEHGNDFDGTAITAIYRTPDLTFNDANLRKVVQKITTYTQLEGTFSANLKVYLERNDPSILQPNAQQISDTGSSFVYENFTYGSFAYSIIANPVFITNTVGSGKLIGFEYSSVDSNSPYRIDSFNIIFAQKAFR